MNVTSGSGITSNLSRVTNLTVTGTGTGFWWNGTWHEVRPSYGDDDGPPTGVREPRRPRPTAPAGAATLTFDESLTFEGSTA